MTTAASTAATPASIHCRSAATAISVTAAPGSPSSSIVARGSATHPARSPLTPIIAARLKAFDPTSTPTLTL